MSTATANLGDTCFFRDKVPQRKAAPTCSVADLLAPLPLPPPGKTWLRKADGEWEVVDTTTSVGTATAGSAVGAGGAVGLAAQEGGAAGAGCVEEAFLEHVVTPACTLAGIALRYSVSEREIRKHNRLFGGNVKTVRVVRVPVTAAHRGRVQLQVLTPEMIVVKLQDLVPRLGAQEARVYLEECGWDLEAAVRMVRADDAWESTPEAAHMLAVHQQQRELDAAPRPVINAAAVVQVSQEVIEAEAEVHHAEELAPLVAAASPEPTTVEMSAIRPAAVVSYVAPAALAGTAAVTATAVAHHHHGTASTPSAPPPRALPIQGSE